MLHRTLGAAAVALALTSTLAFSEPPLGFIGKAVQLDVTQQQSAPVLQVTAGQTYSLFIVGVYSYTGASEIAYPTVWLSANGNGQIPHAGPASQFPFGSVYGRIGNGPAFLIGERRTFLADQSGELRLWINDNNTSDNIGALTLFIYSDGPTL